MRYMVDRKVDCIDKCNCKVNKICVGYCENWGIMIYLIVQEWFTVSINIWIFVSKVQDQFIWFNASSQKWGRWIGINMEKEESYTSTF